MKSEKEMISKSVMVNQKQDIYKSTLPYDSQNGIGKSFVLSSSKKLQEEIKADLEKIPRVNNLITSGFTPSKSDFLEKSFIPIVKDKDKDNKDKKLIQSLSSIKTPVEKQDERFTEFLALIEDKNRPLTNKECDNINTFDSIGDILEIDKIRDPNMSKSLGELQTLCFRWRKVKGDGNCYYRAVFFAYIENIIITGKKQRFCDILFDMDEKIQKEDEIKEKFILCKIDPSILLKGMCSIYEYLNENKVKEAHKLLISCVNNFKEFDYGLILYFRYIFFRYIKENETKHYKENFPILIGNLLPEEYETQEGDFLFNKFYEDYLLKLYSEAEKIIIYLTPFVLDITITMLVWDSSKDNFMNMDLSEVSDNVEDMITIIYNGKHYDIAYNKAFFEKLEEDDNTYPYSIESSKESKDSMVIQKLNEIRVNEVPQKKEPKKDEVPQKIKESNEAEASQKKEPKKDEVPQSTKESNEADASQKKEPKKDEITQNIKESNEAEASQKKESKEDENTQNIKESNEAEASQKEEVSVVENKVENLIDKSPKKTEPTKDDLIQEDYEVNHSILGEPEPDYSGDINPQFTDERSKHEQIPNTSYRGILLDKSLNRDISSFKTSKSSRKRGLPKKTSLYSQSVIMSIPETIKSEFNSKLEDETKEQFDKSKKEKKKKPSMFTRNPNIKTKKKETIEIHPSKPAPIILKCDKCGKVKATEAFEKKMCYTCLKDDIGEFTMKKYKDYVESDKYRETSDSFIQILFSDMEYDLKKRFSELNKIKPASENFLEENETIQMVERFLEEMCHGCFEYGMTNHKAEEKIILEDCCKCVFFSKDCFTKFVNRINEKNFLNNNYRCFCKKTYSPAELRRFIRYLKKENQDEEKINKFEDILHDKVERKECCCICLSNLLKKSVNPVSVENIEHFVCSSCINLINSQYCELCRKFHETKR